jgi:alpha-glucuronidase
VKSWKIDFFKAIACAGLFAAGAIAAAAQTADQVWLNYDLPGRVHPLTPPVIRALGDNLLEQSAVQELERNVGSGTGRSASGPGLSARARAALGAQTIVGTADEVRKAFPDVPVPAHLNTEAYWIAFRHMREGDQKDLFIVGGGPAGVLYGTFSFLRYNPAVAANLLLNHEGAWGDSPAMPIRWTDEWDNANGTVERGYGGPSIFFENGKVRDDLSAVREYARLLASVGINGCNVNNVNGASLFLTLDWIRGLKRIADTMRPWGVHLAISVDIASPQKIGGLKTFDPLDPAVQAWWKAKVDEVYAQIPDLAGFTVKADSEGQAGPASYGRSPADAANLLGHALAPHGGVVLYRAFVYNNHLDYNDLKADRARAAYDIFHPLDGKFAPNVVVQIKYGPIDFQAREPVSPLFAGLEKTSEAMELQITQEYTGQQRHLVYLAPMWKQMLDFDLRAENRATPVREIIEGKSFNQPLGGMIGVSCVGQNGWLGSPLAMANLYAFGRLAWDPNLSAEQIAEEWTRQTINNDPHVVYVVAKMLMQSWPAYEHYTGPLGTQTLTDPTGSHYGPGIEGSERNGWGQWHRDDAEGIGMDRSVATGTGFAGQYPPQVAKMYESAAATPDNLLLFFHHVPYTYKLHSGETVIQYFYDSHYLGAEEAARLVGDWETLKGKLDPALYDDVLGRLEYQAGHAIVWRDAIVQYFLKQSGIPDEKGRAGHYPGRMEAEDARLSGYTVYDVIPWEDASRGKAVVCQEVARLSFPPPDSPAAKPRTCSVEWTYSGTAGRFNIAVQYFDLQPGVAHFALSVNDHSIASWVANNLLPTRHTSRGGPSPGRPNGDNSTRFTTRDVELTPGDVLRVEGTPDASDPAALDYIEIEPAAKRP